MNALTFGVTTIEVERYAATPTLALRVHIEEKTGTPVHTMALRCQVRIDPQRRGYSDSEAGALLDLFDTRHRWQDTLRPFLWMHTSALVQGFTNSTEVSLPLALTYDLEVAAGKYLNAVRDGVIPLSLMFSGTAFMQGDNGFAIQQIPWDSDVSYHLPTQVWREAMDCFFPGSGWIRLPVETLDRLSRFRVEQGLTNWAETLTALLDRAGTVDPTRDMLDGTIDDAATSSAR